MSRFANVLFIILSITYWGCSGSSQSFLEPRTNLNASRYVFIAPLKYNDGSYDQYGVGARLADMFTKKGLIVVREDELKIFTHHTLNTLAVHMQDNLNIPAIVNRVLTHHTKPGKYTHQIKVVQ